MSWVQITSSLFYIIQAHKTRSADRDAERNKDANILINVTKINQEIIN